MGRRSVRRAAKPLDLTLEREIQRDVVRLFRDLGCTVVVLSQVRPSRVSIGLPDLKVFVPHKRTHFWFETKGPKGTQRAAQRAFQQVAEACGEIYVLGGEEAALTQLRAIGLVA